jgi:hypothetical protein
MTLHLEFSEGRLHGEGNDDIGAFMIDGHYDAESCECYWTKTYPGSHAVVYHGYREGKGIWGRWEMGLLAHGGFHIWPRGAGEGTEQAQSSEEVMLANAVSGKELIRTG